MAAAYEPPDPGPLLGLDEIGAVAGVTRGTARAWCESGHLPSICGPSDESLVRRADLEAWLRDRRPAGARVRVIRDATAGADALRRLAAEVSGEIDLATLLDDVVRSAMDVFGLSRMGVWRFDGRRRQPFAVAAEHGIGSEIVDWVAGLSVDAAAAGLTAIRERDVVTFRDVTLDTTAEVRDRYLRNQIRSVCLAPMIFRDEPVGILVLYHDDVHDWIAGRDGPRPGLRRPAGDGRRQRPAGGLGPIPGRPAGRDRGPRDPPQPDART